MQKVTNNVIYLTRGDSATFDVTIWNGGSIYDYSNDTVKMTVKRSLADRNPVIQKTVNALGKIVLEPKDTKDLPAGDYYYDLELTKEDGTIDTVIIPTIFTIGPDVTN